MPRAIPMATDEMIVLREQIKEALEACRKRLRAAIEAAKAREEANRRLPAFYDLAGLLTGKTPVDVYDPNRTPINTRVVGGEFASSLERLNQLLGRGG